MAEVNVKYKDSTIAELNGADTVTLSTEGTYCEGNIEVEYAPRTRIYELTLAKASGWVLLTALDDDVLQHINDEDLTVTLQLMSDFSIVTYVLNVAIATNKQQLSATSSNYPVYGVGLRQNNATNIAHLPIYYPANKTDTSTSLGGAQFRITDGKYYFRPGDGYLGASIYKLIFSW